MVVLLQVRVITTIGEKVSLVVKNSPGFTFSGHSGDVEGGFSAANPYEFSADGDKIL